MKKIFGLERLSEYLDQLDYKFLGVVIMEIHEDLEGLNCPFGMGICRMLGVRITYASPIQAQARGKSLPGLGSKATT